MTITSTTTITSTMTMRSDDYDYDYDYEHEHDEDDGHVEGSSGREGPSAHGMPHSVWGTRFSLALRAVNGYSCGPRGLKSGGAFPILAAGAAGAGAVRWRRGCKP